MLLRFGFRNFLSFNEYSELNLSATKLSDSAADLLETDAIRERVLPAAVIYGANASGKSNFFAALQFLKTLIITSHARLGPEDELGVSPFLLDSEAEKSDSSFDVDFILQGDRYHFGVELNNREIQKEWLYTFSKGERHSRSVLYFRDKSADDEFYFGPSLKGQNATISELTRPNSLFISAAAQNNHQQLTAVQDYFRRSLRFYTVSPRPSDPSYIERVIRDKDKKNRLIRIIKAADLGVTDLEVREEENDDSRDLFINELRELIERHVDFEDGESLPEMPNKEISLLHSGKGGESKALPYVLESRGTVALVNLLRPLLEALDEGKTLVVDELDNSLHPRITREIVSLFNRKETNPLDAQLLFTTHDTTLLTTEVLRRDQIWFTDKNKYGESSIFSLAEFNVRTKDNLSKGYLQGRFGAVPRVSHFLSTETSG